MPLIATFSAIASNASITCMSLFQSDQMSAVSYQTPVVDHETHRESHIYSFTGIYVGQSATSAPINAFASKHAQIETKGEKITRWCPLFVVRLVLDDANLDEPVLLSLVLIDMQLSRACTTPAFDGC